ncbi:MAG: hypothetical protein K2O32_05425 [Acetatifactor sp.]|nr:hypothetical protein [Acetatifactor sp.]
MREIADELREMEICNGYSFFEQMFQSEEYLSQKRRFDANATNNSVWTDRNGKMNRIPYIDRALKTKGICRAHLFGFRLSQTIHCPRSVIANRQWID